MGQEQLIQICIPVFPIFIKLQDMTSAEAIYRNIKKTVIVVMLFRIS